jgi:predicted Zn-dependent protease
MARAGYDLSAIKRVWERLARIEAKQGGQGQGLVQTHPPTKERLAAFEVTLREIRAKQDAGLLLDFRTEEER